MAHDIYKEYKKKIKSKNDDEFWNQLHQREEEKLFYFVLTVSQKVVVVKSGSKTKEKQFLGYEFRNGKGSEGIHPVNGRSTIDDCTKMYNVNNNNDIKKASTYINNAFKGNYFSEIDETLKENVFYTKLEEMLNFNRFDCDLTVSLNVKKKIKIETKWDEKRFGEVANIIKGVTYSKADQTIEQTENIVLTADNITLNGDFEIKKEVYLFDGFNVPEDKKLKKNDIFMCFSSGSKEHLGKVAFIENDTDYLAGGFMGIIRTKNEVKPKYIYQLLNSLLRQSIRDIGSGSNINNLSGLINEIKIPVPPQNVQEKIVKDIEVIETKEKKAIDTILKLNDEIKDIIRTVVGENKKLRELCKYSDKKISSAQLTSKNYIGVDNLLQNTRGKVDSNFVSNTGTSTEYKIGDILLSNIRPYLKKIWFANNNGGSSNDVLVLQSIDDSSESKFIYYTLKQDEFFDYEMQKPKGLKMPRGDKQHIMDYKIILPSLSEQQKIVSKIEKIENQINTLEQKLAEIPNEKMEVLTKYLN